LKAPKTSLALAAIVALPTLAQDMELEEIIVTAEFRSTPLLQQPVSTTVLTSQDIQQRAAQHLEDILNVAPNVNYAGGTSRARFFQIRGIGERSQFVEPLNPSIGFMIDGIDFSGLGTAGTLFDVEQLEILRGPQGTLHGANALAGLINVRTGQPSASPGLRMEATAAEYDTWSVGIVGTGPLISDTLLYRLAVNTYQSDGFIENDYLDRDNTNDRDETSVRGKLRWLASERSSLDLTALYVDIDNGYDAFSLDNTRHTLSDNPGKDTQESTALGLNWSSEFEALIMEVNLSAANSDSEYSYDEDWRMESLDPSYSSTDQYLRERDSYSAELRLVSSERSRIFADSTDWVTGLYYLGDREDLQRNYTYLESAFLSRYDTDTYALFGQLDSQLGERWKLISGLRVERRNTDYSDSNAVDSDPGKTLWGGRLALEYDLDSPGILYGGISRGYRANGINANILASMNSTDDPEIIGQLEPLQQYDDEHLINYELGYKAALLGGRLSTRLALFYMDRQDQQVKGSLVIPREDGSTAFIDYTNNAAEGTNYGAELETNWLASEQLELYANIGLLETEFDEYINADGEDLSGRDQAHAPGYQYAIGGRYDFGRNFYLRVDLEGKDDYYFSDRHDLKSPSYDLLHMRLGYTTEQWSVALWARNLTDEDYFVRGFGSFGNDPRKGYVVEPYYQYGEPRMVGVTFDFNFGSMER
jgi:outer membrane receptor protein involved in Fe transport